MKIGLDYHGVITANPKLFSRLSARLCSAGVEIHIITGSKITDEFKKTLEGYVIHYTHLFSISDYHYKLGTLMKGYDENKTYIDQDIWDRTKGDYCYRENIDLHIDDCEKYGEYFRTPFVLMDKKKKNGLVDIDVTQHSTGLNIAWVSNAFGWGHLRFGIRDGNWFADTECMSENFVTTLLIEAAPQIAKIICQIEEGKVDDEKTETEIEKEQEEK